MDNEPLSLYLDTIYGGHNIKTECEDTQLVTTAELIGMGGKNSHIWHRSLSN